MEQLAGGPVAGASGGTSGLKPRVPALEEVLQALPEHGQEAAMDQAVHASAPEHGKAQLQKHGNL